MNVLAMDCSGAVGSVAVVQYGVVVFEREFACPRGRGTEVFRILEEALASVTKPDRIVVGIGPGSYNGLRVTVAAAEGLALAVGADRVGALSILGLDGGDDFWAAGDTRGGTVYLARITKGKVVGEIENLPRAEAVSRITPHSVGLPMLVPSPIDGLPGAVIAHPKAARLAAIGELLPPVSQIHPYYAKPVHITAPNPTPRLS